MEVPPPPQVAAGRASVSGARSRLYACARKFDTAEEFVSAVEKANKTVAQQINKLTKQEKKLRELMVGEKPEQEAIRNAILKDLRPFQKGEDITSRQPILDKLTDFFNRAKGERPIPKELQVTEGQIRAAAGSSVSDMGNPSQVNRAVDDIGRQARSFSDQISPSGAVRPSGIFRALKIEPSNSKYLNLNDVSATVSLYQRAKDKSRSIRYYDTRAGSTGSRPLTLSSFCGIVQKYRSTQRLR